MDEQRDLLEEYANMLLAHEECNGCTECSNGQNVSTVDDIQNLLKSDPWGKFAQSVEMARKQAIADMQAEADMLEDLHNLLEGDPWSMQY